MRESGIWHAGLAQLIVSMRHTETLVVADAGLPVPDHVQVVDLGWARGEPRLAPVLTAILAELVVERVTIAHEARDGAVGAAILADLANIPVDEVTHDEFKAHCAHARAVVRTGDDTPFANVILHAGVPFGVAAHDVLSQSFHASERVDRFTLPERNAPK